MIYIPHIKQRIDELSPKWDKEALTPEELNEFFDLLDEVVLEARESRSDSIIHIDRRPEAFLVNLFQRRLKNTIILFFLRYPQHFPEATDEETPQFKEWLGYAKSMTEAIILGDAANRLTRRNQIREYLEPLPCPANSEDPINRSKEDFIKGRHLDANNKRLFALKKELIQQQNALKKESRQRQDHVEWNYTPWAEQCALNEGVGYNPNYKQARLEDFSSRLEDAEDLTKSWEEGKYHDDFKTRSELDDYMRSTYIGCLPSRILEDIESLKKRRPNLVHFLFGSKKKRGELYWRLVELYRFTSNRKEIVRDDFQEISDAQECERFVNDMWVTDSPTSDSDSDIDKDLENKLKQLGLTKKQSIVSMMRIDKMTISSIARELKISKRAVYKHLAKIKKSLNFKKSFLNDNSGSPG